MPAEQLALDFASAERGLRWPAPEGANRHIVLQGEHVLYRLDWTRRRTMGCVVTLQGLVVRSPRWVGVRQIEAFLLEKAAWILRHLETMRKRQQQPPVVAPVYQHGSVFQLWGQDWVVQLGADVVQVHEAQRQLSLPLPRDAQGIDVESVLAQWLQTQARQLLTQRLNHHAPLLGVRWSRLSLSHARTRWGSARQDGHIRLHWRLVHLPLSLVDYVVVHELAHLHEMNHSPRFWAWVERILPDHQERRRSLRQVDLSQWR
jgi:predicted metal-dependent hydrolase